MKHLPFASKTTKGFAAFPRLAALIVLLLWTSACQVAGSLPVPAGGSGGQTGIVATQAATATETATSTPSPTATFTHTPSPTPTIFPLASFESVGLRPEVQPQQYIKDTCRYLDLRWGEGKAEPGTIVVPVMYHSVAKDGRPVQDNISVTAKYFRETMQHARDLGFETITTEQLIDFLYNNAAIPPRSLLLIVDDRRIGVVRNHFLPILNEYHWTVTMAYITGVMFPSEWADLEDLYKTGRIDVQVHGFMHNGQTYFTEFTEPETIYQELNNALPLIQEHLGYTPRTFIWPGGNFLPEAISEARKAGYQVALTAYSRGPVMFNWVPLGEEERAMNDPLMVLPRFWSTAAYMNLDEAVKIGDAARAYAAENKAAEQQWFDTYCYNYDPAAPTATFQPLDTLPTQTMTAQPSQTGAPAASITPNLSQSSTSTLIP